MHATLVRADQCVADDISGVVVQANVVEGELERLARAVDERRDPPRDVQRRLPAVGEGVDLDRGDQNSIITLIASRSFIAR